MLLLPTPPLLAIGIDEAGRGCWAGPVVAGAVLLRAPIEGLNDSKKLSHIQRERLVPRIKAEAQAWAVGEASASEIDELNILNATFLAMARAVDRVLAQLSAQSTDADPLLGGELWVDGSTTPRFFRVGWTARTFIKGDGTHANIAAASILAKEHRDNLMRAMDLQHPGYGFAQHMSYGTPMHMAALQKLGPCDEHRKSFKPIARLLPLSS